MHLTLGSATYDLTTRAVVLDDGAYAVAPDEASVEGALRGGAVLIGLPAPTAAALERCAAAGVTVVVPPSALAAAAAAGLPPERVVADSMLVDVTDAGCPVAATAVGVIGGARVVRTKDVAGARRVCAVLAAILEAR